MADFIGAVDQGTTSTRFMIFDHDGREVGRHQLEHEQILPRAGWVEHNPLEIWERTQTVIGTALTSTGLQVVSIITAESADNLELREGINTTATIKAPWVIISTGDAPTSARNHFSGKVQSVQLGEIEAEVLVTLDEGTTVCAVITSQSARVLKLEPGKPVSVLFKAFAVVLGM